MNDPARLSLLALERTLRGDLVSGNGIPDARWETTMIRATTPQDTAAILALAVSSGLFPADATAEVAAVLTGSLAGENGPDHV